MAREEGKTPHEEPAGSMVDLGVEKPIWERFFVIAPLVVVGTREGEGYNLAPKHMATQLGWENHFAFVCSRTHATYHNAVRAGAFTVSFPRPDQMVEAGITAQAREGPGAPTPGLDMLSTVAAEAVDGVLLAGAHLHLECELERVVDGFGESSLVAGRIVAARVRKEALRSSERRDREVLKDAPLLAYVAPGRVSPVSAAEPFPFPANFRI